MHREGSSAVIWKVRDPSPRRIRLLIVRGSGNSYFEYPNPNDGTLSVVKACVC